MSVHPANITTSPNYFILWRIFGEYSLEKSLVRQILPLEYIWQKTIFLLQKYMPADQIFVLENIACNKKLHCRSCTSQAKIPSSLELFSRGNIRYSRIWHSCRRQTFSCWVYQTIYRIYIGTPEEKLFLLGSPHFCNDQWGLITMGMTNKARYLQGIQFL